VEGGLIPEILMMRYEICGQDYVHDFAWFAWFASLAFSFFPFPFLIFGFGGVLGAGKEGQGLHCGLLGYSLATGIFSIIVL
jgi:hypothetical protein